jgi:hypothetical protein
MRGEKPYLSAIEAATHQLFVVLKTLQEKIYRMGNQRRSTMTLVHQSAHFQKHDRALDAEQIAYGAIRRHGILDDKELVNRS